MTATRAILLGGEAVHDPYFSDVVQLAHFNGTNGSTTFTNSCPRGNTLTGAAGSPAISTTQFKFSGSSLNLPASPNAALHAASHADYNFGSGDLTIEWFQRLNGIAAATNQAFIDMRPTGTTGVYPLILTTGSGNIIYNVNAVSRITASSVLLATTWQFIALAKVSGTTRLFVDGTQVGSSYTDGNTYLQTGIFVGLGAFSNAPSPGYFAELRLTKDVGRYTSNFTPPIAPFPNQ